MFFQEFMKLKDFDNIHDEKEDSPHKEGEVETKDFW